MNILVVRTDKLGDFITALPAVSVLKNYDKNNKIIVCIAPLNKALAEACEFIDEVIVDKGQSVFELSKQFKDANIDASITLFSNTRVAFAQFLAKIPKSIAPATKIAQIFYTNRVKQRRSEVKMAEFEYNLELTKELFHDIDLSYKKPLLEFNSIFHLYKNYICFHVGFGGSSDANWTLDEYEILIREVLKNEENRVILSFGPDEENLLEDMKKRFNNDEVVLYLSSDGLVDFAKLISYFKVFISTSTGTYHLASLVGTPTITFFADSLFASAKRWKSVGDEKLQKHFMIPSDADKRKKMFEDVKKELRTI
ncbi:MAG: glycosyltransferase family 9 protein [Campylobacterota bacterium]|nr:glycosyltransferase family 9 protein [Campylobacterota bacterium]